MEELEISYQKPSSSRGKALNSESLFTSFPHGIPSSMQHFCPSLFLNSAGPSSPVLSSGCIQNRCSVGPACQAVKESRWRRRWQPSPPTFSTALLLICIPLFNPYSPEVRSPAPWPASTERTLRHGERKPPRAAQADAKMQSQLHRQVAGGGAWVPAKAPRGKPVLASACDQGFRGGMHAESSSRAGRG